MRRVLYDRAGVPQHYLTGAGVLFDLANVPLGALQEGQLVSLEGRVVAWFGDGFVWDASGILAFVKGATPPGDLTLPKTAPLRARLAPTPAPLHPLLVRLEPPPMRWVWSDGSLVEVLQTGQVA